MPGPRANPDDSMPELISPRDKAKMAAALEVAKSLLVNRHSMESDSNFVVAQAIIAAKLFSH